MITKFQYKILKKALKNHGYNPRKQRQIDACTYLFRKNCLSRARDGKHEYIISQEGEVAIKAYFQDISIIALITGIFSISIQSEPLLKLLEQLLK